GASHRSRLAAHHRARRDHRPYGDVAWLHHWRRQPCRYWQHHSQWCEDRQRVSHRRELAYRREQGNTGLFDGAWFARQDRPHARPGNRRGASPFGRPLRRELEEIPRRPETDRLMRRASFLLIFLFTFVLFGCDGEEVRRAVIETKSGAVHAFELELALTPEEQQKGLMFRTKLPENAGMLFF